MGFTFVRNFPILECIFSNSPLAFIRTRTRKLKVVKIRPINDEFFVCKWGWFRLKPEWNVSFEKQAVAEYTSFNNKPYDAKALKELELFMIKTDRIQLEKWIEVEDKTLLKQVEDESGMNLSTENVLDENGNPVLDENGNIKQKPIEETKIRKIYRALREPINPFVETWLAQYQSVDPQPLVTGTEAILKAVKIEKLMSSSVAPKIPIMLIFGGIAIAFIVMSNAGNLVDHFFEGLKSLGH